VKVAAYQMPVNACYGNAAIHDLRERVRECEQAGVALLCCPEAALGGLADYVDTPAALALPVDPDLLAAKLAPLSSETVTVICGFTECDGFGQYYDAAAVCLAGKVLGVYRKRHVALRRSRYTPRFETPVFPVADRTLGIMICRDSVDADLAADLVHRGAHLLCIPTNNAMPIDRGGTKLIDDVRALDARLADTLGVPILRADVVGETRGLMSAGSSMITLPRGEQTRPSALADGELVMADLP
jgi:predicted amidohydrolase